MARRLELACEFDELSENSVLNQILKTTLMVLLQHAVSVAGLLFYSRTEAAVQPAVTYQMSGNQIGACTLDLNQEFSGNCEATRPDSSSPFFRHLGQIHLSNNVCLNLRNSR